MTRRALFLAFAAAVLLWVGIYFAVRAAAMTASLWETFCGKAERLRLRGPCYAVAAAQDVPEAVRERLEGKGVPLVHEAAAAGFAVLIVGDPSEWKAAASRERVAAYFADVRAHADSQLRRRGSKAEAPICECGQPGMIRGDYWICGNPDCGGFGQIMREVRPIELDDPS